MTRFSDFTDIELNIMEEAFYIEGALLLVEEIDKERRYREESEAKNECNNSQN